MMDSSSSPFPTANVPQSHCRDNTILSKLKITSAFPLCLRKHAWKPKTLLFQMTSPAAHTCFSYSAGCVVTSSQHQTGRKAWKQQLTESLRQPRHSPPLRTFQMFESLSWTSRDSREGDLNVMLTKRAASPDTCLTCIARTVSPEKRPLKTGMAEPARELVPSDSLGFSLSLNTGWLWVNCACL